MLPKQEPHEQAVETVHVVFGMSNADTLREVLPLLGGSERVIGLPEMLSVGPRRARPETPARVVQVRPTG